MICWDESLYMDEEVAQKPTKYKKRIQKQSRPGCFCVTVSKNQGCGLEIYNSATPWFRYRTDQGVYIVGIASSYENALEIVKCIVQDVWKQSSAVNVHTIDAFFAKRSRR